MVAYVISEVEVIDPTLMDTYRSLAQATIAAYGGRYIVRGGPVDTVEGGPPAKMIIVVEFPSMERAREWYRSPEYAEALEVRHSALDRRLLFVEGIAPP
jgi:uncharacterized protein (DUF1330 family)